MVCVAGLRSSSRMMINRCFSGPQIAESVKALKVWGKLFTCCIHCLRIPNIRFVESPRWSDPNTNSRQPTEKKFERVKILSAELLLECPQITIINSKSEMLQRLKGRHLETNQFELPHFSFFLMPPLRYKTNPHPKFVIKTKKKKGGGASGKRRCQICNMNETNGT